MELQNQIESDLKTAMKSAAADRTAVLRLLLAGLKNERIKLGHDLNQEEAMKLVQREAKQRKDSITAYTAAGRPELAKAEADELDIIESYLPQQLSEQELSQLVDQAITQANATSMAQMGAVIGMVMSQAGGKADGARVSALVKERLS